MTKIEITDETVERAFQHGIKNYNWWDSPKIRRELKEVLTIALNPPAEPVTPQKRQEAFHSLQEAVIAIGTILIEDSCEAMRKLERSGKPFGEGAYAPERRKHQIPSVSGLYSLFENGVQIGWTSDRRRARPQS